MSVLREGWGEVQSQGRRVRFLIAGRAAADTLPLVLLPSLGNDAAHWGAFGERLSDRRQTIALDPPGFGRSSSPPRLPSTRSSALDVLAALQSLGLRRFELFGCSWGALLATRVALSAPESVAHLVLASAAARGRDFRPGPKQSWRLLGDFARNARPKPAIARDLASGASPRTERRLGGAGWSRGRLLRFVAGAWLHDASRELPLLTMPTLVLHGERDVLLAPRTQARLLRGLPRPLYRELPGAGHDLVAEAPAACAELIDVFLRS